MAYVSSNLSFKQVRPQRNFKTIELLAFETKIGASDLLIVGMYRPPKVVGEHYFLRLEEELNFVSTSNSMLRNFVVITGDLNLDRLRPDKREGKLLLDLEDVHNFNCLINERVRVTTCLAHKRNWTLS